MRVLIVDDHLLFGEAVRSLLESEGFEVVGVATSGAAALVAAAREAPDIVLIDASLPDTEAVALGRSILEAHPAAKLMMVTGTAEAGAVDDAIAAGFQGYVTKSARSTQLLSSIRAVEEGNMVFSTPIRTNGHRQPQTTRNEGAMLARYLTPRERQVLGLLVEGASGKEMARRLALQPNTVRTHVQNVLTKLQVHSRLEAASTAVRLGLLDLTNEEKTSAR